MEIEIEEDDEFITTVEFGKSIIFSHYEKTFSTDKNYPFARFAISQQACEKAIAEWQKFKQEAT